MHLIAIQASEEARSQVFSRNADRLSTYGVYDRKETRFTTLVTFKTGQGLDSRKD